MSVWLFFPYLIKKVASMPICALLSGTLTLRLWGGHSVVPGLRMEDSVDRRSPVKAISRDTGVIVAETAPLRNDGGANRVDPQLFELLIGNRWQSRLNPACCNKRLLWCSAAQVLTIPVLAELDTRATQVNAVSRMATASQDTNIEPLLFSGSGKATGI
ncbi:MAG: hypothetical protein CME33_05120 [Gimesia sp.]|nr:hypothetical protein [Gimesia sp.]|tara:strand:- start:450 stop:926 length:477 start_codon:yes stop_codon:yes gene_type:complete